MPDFISYDQRNDAITIDGVVYAREMFAYFANAAIGSVGRIVKRDNGVITITTIDPAVVATIEAAVSKRRRRRELRRAA